MKPLAPKTILQNRYQIKKLIGKGGMGEVYMAIDQRLGHKVALKRTTVTNDVVLTDAFEREAKTLAQLRHSVLPKVSDHFREGDEQFLIMEYISGEDLSQKLKATNKPFPLNWVMFWADQLLESLTYLHTYNPPIIHRDIKPQNLKLTDENQIVLLDFGLSKNTVNKNEVTTSGSVVGYTPHYAPMEQIRGTGTNASSDVFSLSATLYHLLSNTNPPDALTRADAILTGLPDPLKPLTELNPEITQAISDAILKGMSINQSHRFKTARDMQKVLRRAFNDMQSSMSAQTVAFNVSEEDIAIADAKTEAISNVPMETDEIPASSISIDSDKQTVTHQPNLDSTAPIASFSDTDYSAEKTEAINVGDLPDDVNFESAEQTSAYSEFDTNSSTNDLEGAVTQVGPNEPISNETVADNFATQDEIPAEVPVENDLNTNDDFQVADFQKDDDVAMKDDFAPEATVPLISMEDSSVENNVYEESLETSEDSGWDEEFDSAGNDTTNEVVQKEEIESTPASVGFTEQFTDDEVEEEFVSETDSEPKYQTESTDENESVAGVATPNSVPSSKPPEAKSSTGKYVAILGGLGAILFLLIGSVVAIGLYYNGTFGTGTETEPVMETTPNPQVTPEEVPTVEPEPEIVETENTNTEGNSETETTEGNTETTDGEDPDSGDNTTDTKTENPTTTKTESTRNTKTTSPKTRDTKTTKTQNTSRTTRTTKKTTKRNTKRDTKKTPKTTKKPTPKPKKKVKNPGVI